MGFNIPSSAQINWETLALHDTVQSDGYVEILVANESDVPTFFDNIHVTLEESMIVQESHFYPYGMQMMGIGKTPMLENRWAGYNGGGSEKQKDLVGKGYMLETDFRPYDPQLGRFHMIDPLADIFGTMTTYQFAFDNPIMFQDPTGLDPCDDPNVPCPDDPEPDPIEPPTPKSEPWISHTKVYYTTNPDGGFSHNQRDPEGKNRTHTVTLVTTLGHDYAYKERFTPIGNGYFIKNEEISGVDLSNASREITTVTLDDAGFVMSYSRMAVQYNYLGLPSAIKIVVSEDSDFSDNPSEMKLNLRNVRDDRKRPEQIEIIEEDVKGSGVMPFVRRISLEAGQVKGYSAFKYKSLDRSRFAAQNEQKGQTMKDSDHSKFLNNMVARFNSYYRYAKSTTQKTGKYMNGPFGIIGKASWILEVVDIAIGIWEDIQDSSAHKNGGTKTVVEWYMILDPK